ncbi:MAG: hypothetical protein ABFC96_11720 [Thermoguttaceae bacterium]
MTRRRTIKSILYNFLGTYTSRYSDYDGYWLFGMFVGSMNDLRIYLLAPGEITNDGPAMVFAAQLASRRFHEQMEKARLPMSCIKDASLCITKASNPVDGIVNGQPRSGHLVKFAARAVSDHGAVYEQEMSVFVAPHDSNIERRSARGLTP